ncbi:MAG: hypothetical protein BWZ02_02703 [Lentisphaerae bacterium ADurb.BinA184]|nr:MAG: hypothetical protein BWZ02_02703 [Lentisphaerae bacterium ADurb.BinA184]
MECLRGFEVPQPDKEMDHEEQLGESPGGDGGGGGDGATWTDADNWDLDSGSPGAADQAWFTGAATIAAGIPASVNRIITGTGAVSIAAGMSFPYVPSPNTAGGLTVGTGGASFTGLLSFPNGNAYINAAGNLTCNDLSWGNTATITQTGGQFDINTFRLPGNSGSLFDIQAWQFAASKPVTIGNPGTPTTNLRFVGTPIFQSGHRPNWTFSSGTTSGVKVNLNGQTLFGNVLQLEQTSASGRYTYLTNDAGSATVDVNSVVIGVGSPESYLDLDNTTVHVRGSGTAWDNRSTANTAFNVTDNTTVNVHASCNLDTGSRNLGTGGFINNFAFGNLTLKSGVKATITGNANLATGENDALYVNGSLALEDGSELAMDSREAYVNGPLTVGNSPGTATVSGGNLTLTDNASFVVEVNGLTAGSQYDQLIVSGGNITLAGDLVVQPGPFTANAWDVVYLISNTSGTTSGVFQYADDTFVDVFAGKRWFITYDADLDNLLLSGGNDVALYAVPEPAAAATLLLGGLALLRRRARK